MRSALRLFALWLVTVALPFHGMAMATKLPAMSGAPHVANAADASALHVPARPAMHGAAEATAHAHDGDAHPRGHGHAHQQDAFEPGHCIHSSPVDSAGGCTSGDHEHGPLECCSAGCAAAVISTAKVATRALAPSAAPLQLPAELHAGVVLDQLDRPPKPILA